MAARLGQEENTPAGYSKRLSSKAAASEKAKAYASGTLSF